MVATEKPRAHAGTSPQELLSASAPTADQALLASPESQVQEPTALQAWLISLPVLDETQRERLQNLQQQLADSKWRSGPTLTHEEQADLLTLTRNRHNGFLRDHLLSILDFAIGDSVDSGIIDSDNVVHLDRKPTLLEASIAGRPERAEEVKVTIAEGKPGNDPCTSCSSRGPAFGCNCH